MGPVGLATSLGTCQSTPVLSLVSWGQVPRPLVTPVPSLALGTGPQAPGDPGAQPGTWGQVHRPQAPVPRHSTPGGQVPGPWS